MKLAPFFLPRPLQLMACDIATEEHANNFLYTIGVFLDVYCTSHEEVSHRCLFPRVASSACGKTWKELRGAKRLWRGWTS